MLKETSSGGGNLLVSASSGGSRETGNRGVVCFAEQLQVLVDKSSLGPGSFSGPVKAVVVVLSTEGMRA